MCLASVQSRSMWCVQHLETLRKYFFAENIIPRGWTGASLSIVRSISSQKGVFPGSLHLRQHNERSLCKWRWETKRVHIARNGTYLLLNTQTLQRIFQKYLVVELSIGTICKLVVVLCQLHWLVVVVVRGNGAVQIAVSQKPTILNSCCSPANNCQSISKKILKWNTSHISSQHRKIDEKFSYPRSLTHTTWWILGQSWNLTTF